MTAIASIPELLSAFAALTNADLLALRKAASMLLDGTQYTEPSDLIHEALIRCLNGTRTWPTHVPFTVFLANAMRSIAGADRRSKAAQTTRPESHYVTENFFEPLNYFAPRSPSAEEAYLSMLERERAEQEIDRLREAFNADPVASVVLTGWLSGLSTQEIVADNLLPFKEYDAARKRLRRKVAADRKLLGE